MQEPQTQENKLTVKKLRKLFLEVAERCGYEGPIPEFVIIHVPKLIGVLSDNSQLQADEGILSLVGERCLKAFIAHEIGHLIQPNKETLTYLEEVFGLVSPFKLQLMVTQEREADVFAARHGYGEDLMDGLDILYKGEDATPWYDPLSERKRLIRASMPSLSLEASA